MISIWCIGFESLDVVCDEPNDCAWNIGLYQLSDLISVLCLLCRKICSYRVLQ